MPSLLLKTDTSRYTDHGERQAFMLVLYEMSLTKRGPAVGLCLKGIFVLM